MQYAIVCDKTKYSVVHAVDLFTAVVWEFTALL